MELRTVRRGFAALAIAAILGLAGAHPAAAEEPGLFERSLRWLSGLWAAGSAAPNGPEDRGLMSIWVTETVEKGMGVDPNGNPVPGGTPPPPAGGE